MMDKRLGVEHFGYKVIALLIAMILWVTVVSQKDMVSKQKISVQFVVPSGYEIEGSPKLEVEVKLEGPRPILKKFLEKYWPTTLMIPVRNPSVGPSAFEIPPSYFQVPSEIKIISIVPREVVLQIIQSPTQ